MAIIHRENRFEYIINSGIIYANRYNFFTIICFLNNCKYLIFF